MSEVNKPTVSSVSGTGLEGSVAGGLCRTPLYDLHLSAGAKMVPFAGFTMPVSYSLGTLKEHLHVREKAGLFDVSHMGQFLISSDGDAAKLMEDLVLADLCACLKRIGFIPVIRWKHRVVISDGIHGAYSL